MKNEKQNIDLFFYEKDFDFRKYISKDKIFIFPGLKFFDIKEVDLFKYGFFKYVRKN